MLKPKRGPSAGGIAAPWPANVETISDYRVFLVFGKCKAPQNYGSSNVFFFFSDLAPGKPPEWALPELSERRQALRALLTRWAELCFHVLAHVHHPHCRWGTLSTLWIISLESPLQKSSKSALPRGGCIPPWTLVIAFYLFPNQCTPPWRHRSCCSSALQLKV